MFSVVVDQKLMIVWQCFKDMLVGIFVEVQSIGESVVGVVGGMGDLGEGVEKVGSKGKDVVVKLILLQEVMKWFCEENEKFKGIFGLLDMEVVVWENFYEVQVLVISVMG